MVGRPKVPASMVEKAVHGDAEAFSEIYRLIYYKLVNYLVGALSRAQAKQAFQLAEDIAQETFERAWGKRDKFIFFENVPYEAYLYAISRNLVASYLRKPESGRKIICDGGLQHMQEAYVANLNKSLDDNQELIFAGRLIGELSVGQQQVMTVVLLGYTSRESAFLLDKSVNNIKVQTHKGRTRLKTRLREQRHKGLSQMLLIALADSLIKSRAYLGRPFKDEGRLLSSLKQSLNKRFGLPNSEVENALVNLPEGFLGRLLALNSHSMWPTRKVQ